MCGSPRPSSVWLEQLEEIRGPDAARLTRPGPELQRLRWNQMSADDVMCIAGGSVAGIQSFLNCNRPTMRFRRMPPRKAAAGEKHGRASSVTSPPLQTAALLPAVAVSICF